MKHVETESQTTISIFLTANRKHIYVLIYVYMCKNNERLLALLNRATAESTFLTPLSKFQQIP